MGLELQSYDQEMNFKILVTVGAGLDWKATGPSTLAPKHNLFIYFYMMEQFQVDKGG